MLVDVEGHPCPAGETRGPNAQYAYAETHAGCEKTAIAQETLEIYAPLANRPGYLVEDGA